MFVIHHPDISLHDASSRVGGLAGGRLEAVTATLLALPEAREVLATVPPDEALLRVHDAEYLDYLTNVNGILLDGDVLELDEDTTMSSHTMRAVRLSVGAALQGLKLLRDGKGRFVFCPVLAGHHAMPRHAEGFCVLNGAAIVARQALAEGMKVAVLDFDTHSGNGTIAALDGKDGVLFAETFQAGYPGPVETAHGNIMRLEANSREQWLKAWEALLMWIRECEAEVLVLSAGFDAHKSDPLGRVGLEDEDYAWLFTQLAELGLPTLALLEGGYSVETTCRLADILSRTFTQPG